MLSITFALAATVALLPMASAQDSSKIVSIPTPTATVPASAMVEIGCFETGIPLEDHGKGEFVSPGSCQQICLGLNKDVLGLSDGTNCWCGMEFPPIDSQVDNSTCRTPCSGTDEYFCGGKKKLWVMTTGNTRNEIDYFEPESSSSSSVTSSQPASTSKSAQTVVVSASAVHSAEPDKGPNKIGIAVGVVVGVLALCAMVGGVFFWLRMRKRRELEEEHRRQAAVNSFVSGGKLRTGHSSMADSRLDPDFMSRRQSNGSIADNEDYSRRILKVTNA